MYGELNHTYYPTTDAPPPRVICVVPLEAGLQISWKALHGAGMFANVYTCGLQEFCLHAKLPMDFITSDQRGGKRTPRLSKQERRADASTLQTPRSLHFNQCYLLSRAGPNRQRKRSRNGSPDLRPKDECFPVNKRRLRNGSLHFPPH